MIEVKKQGALLRKPGLVKKLTTSFGIIQFSKLNHPDIGSGYTLADNSSAS